MTKRDSSQPILHLADIPAAIGLLTRLPIRVDLTQATQRASLSAWAWPLAGVVPAVIGWGLGCAAISAGLSPLFAACLALLGQIMVTGALHEDGLADVADGFWGGYDRPRRLEIMKDSRIGAYGVIALILSLGLRASALSVLLATSSGLPALIVIAISSRLPMVLLMAAIPNARGHGLASQVGRPPAATAWLASGISALAVLILMPSALPALLVFTGLGTLALTALAKAKIGGQTGDVLGASQQIAEIIGLAVIVSLVA
ncbi:cobalamin-5'-phosphate synthase [Aliiroseovarius halocynthiae]|uniref:Adenosylcobinamide-GDP ribazoletransferase n=1 Tax=Aliiroseovarius halocynthiae TaxID=985055 RepID=A0A545SVN1_9RHOB|nr:adenosylcobinamide-GDP ribazoletransferase [Aliiroseovarius halocynthiae]TQV69025.1 adenosylcobinamide-GDP ribazoletransferase [Aliiroseovarius halocynthiae]SMR71776.1 cobalamin-5'-phosphate synthase [Aliiroseovarius halocynthiae]